MGKYAPKAREDTALFISACCPWVPSRKISKDGIWRGNPQVGIFAGALHFHVRTATRAGWKLLRRHEAGKRALGWRRRSVRVHQYPERCPAKGVSRRSARM